MMSSLPEWTWYAQRAATYSPTDSGVVATVATSPAHHAAIAFATDIVKRNGFLLETFTLALRSERSVVEAAVRENGKAIMFASPSLQADIYIAGLAILQNPEAKEWVPPLVIHLLVRTGIIAS